MRPPEFSTHLLSEVRAFCLTRSHLNPFASPTQKSLREQRLAGARPLTYRDAVNAIRLARRDGNRRGGIGAQLAAAMLNAIVWDSLEPGESPDLVVVPCEPANTLTAVMPPELQELAFVRAQSQLHDCLIECAADGVLDEKETGLLRRLKAREDREFDDVLRALVVNGGVRR